MNIYGLKKRRQNIVKQLAYHKSKGNYDTLHVRTLKTARRSIDAKIMDLKRLKGRR